MQLEEMQGLSKASQSVAENVVLQFRKESNVTSNNCKFYIWLQMFCRQFSVCVLGCLYTFWLHFIFSGSWRCLMFWISILTWTNPVSVSVSRLCCPKAAWVPVRKRRAKAAPIQTSFPEPPQQRLQLWSHEQFQLAQPDHRRRGVGYSQCKSTRPHREPQSVRWNQASHGGD